MAKKSSQWLKKIAGWIKDPLSLFGAKTPPIKHAVRRMRKTSKKKRAPKRVAKPKKKHAPKKIKKKLAQKKAVSRKVKLKLVQIKAAPKGKVLRSLKVVKVVAKPKKAPKPIKIKPPKKTAFVKVVKPANRVAPKAQKQNGVLVGKITHYFSKAGACAIKIEKTELKEGASIRIYGPTTDFKMVVKSIQINRIPVPSGRPGEDIGIGVTKPVAVGDSIYLI